MKDTVALIILTAAFSIMLSSLDIGLSKTIGISGVLAMFYLAILDSKNK